jgi:predicted ribosome quality control (RQC) complex YloA/Tae2 family protein
MSYSVEYRRELVSIANVLNQSFHILDGMASDVKDDRDKQMILYSLGTMCFYVSKIYTHLVVHMQDLNVLFEAIEQLQKEAKNDEVIKALEDIKKKLDKRVESAKDEIEKSEEIESKSKEYGFYG